MEPSDLREYVKGLPTYSEELGLDLTRASDRFKWFVASILFSSRISSSIAKSTYQKLDENGFTSPEGLIMAGWNRIVTALDSGGYTRYDFSTATYLLEDAKKLQDEYGSLDELHRQSSDPRDLERRLKEFKGMGPVGVNIFLRELRGIWDKAQPKPQKNAVEIAEKIGLDDVEKYESQLVRLFIEHCKKHDCERCPLEHYCKKE
jgi:endonuclease III